jgi:hypothetical protein
MRLKKTRIVAVVAVIGALAAGGAAFTASNPISSENTAGYGSVAVTGATVTDISNTLSTDAQNITQVKLTFATALTGLDQVHIGFGPAVGVAPTSVTIPCTVAGDYLSATCGTGLDSGPLAPTTSQSFAVAVNH